MNHSNWRDAMKALRFAPFALVLAACSTQDASTTASVTPPGFSTVEVAACSEIGPGEASVTVLKHIRDFGSSYEAVLSFEDGTTKRFTSCEGNLETIPERFD